MKATDLQISREERVAQLRLRGARVLLYAVIAILLLPFVFPLWWMVTSSLQPFVQQYWNSLYIAILVTAGVLLISSMAGYAFARIRFPGANLFFLILIAGLLIPREVIIIPLFQMFQQFGLVDSHLPLILIPMFGAQSVFDAYGGQIWNVKLAATTMMTLPVLFVYVLAQRHFIRGIAQTGLKG